MTHHLHGDPEVPAGECCAEATARTHSCPAARALQFSVTYAKDYTQIEQGFRKVPPSSGIFICVLFGLVFTAGTYHAPQADLQLEIPLPECPRCWGYRQEPWINNNRNVMKICHHAFSGTSR